MIQFLKGLISVRLKLAVKKKLGLMPERPPRSYKLPKRPRRKSGAKAARRPSTSG